MNEDRLLVFDLSGEYGHFRKFNTTTSPLTYFIPTRMALTGILGATLGIERESAPGRFPAGVVPVQEMFSSAACGLAVQLLAPIRKVNIGFNLIDTGKEAASFFNIRKGGRTQIEFELLKNPSFRVFTWLKDASLFDTLAQKLLDRSHHFTPYLGLSQFTATIQNVTVTQAVRRVSASSFVPIHSAVNLSLIRADQPIEFDREAHYNVETMPIELSRDRIVLRYGEILADTKGDAVRVHTGEWFETSQFGNLLFL
jgi:CRISPR-associated protein Cas5h